MQSKGRTFTLSEYFIKELNLGENFMKIENYCKQGKIYATNPEMFRTLLINRNDYGMK